MAFSASRRSVNLEQFYTHPDNVDFVLKVLMDQHWFLDIVEAIEPSAGSGAFSLPLEEKFGSYMTVHAFDLEPKHPSVTKQDFLTLDFAKLELPPKDFVLGIGNPPFGSKSKLAKQFWEKLAPVCGYCAFIVPKAMALPKGYTQIPRVPVSHDVLLTLSLPVPYFISPEGKKHAIKGTALVITRHKEFRYEE